MSEIYDPQNPPPDDAGVTPNIELLENELRLFFHEAGISFGLVDPFDSRFSVVISYDKAREKMLRAAKESKP